MRAQTPKTLRPETSCTFFLKFGCPKKNRASKKRLFASKKRLSASCPDASGQSLVLHLFFENGNVGVLCGVALIHSIRFILALQRGALGRNK